MDNLEKLLAEAGESVRLDVRERAETRATLRAYARGMPLSEQEKADVRRRLVGFIGENPPARARMREQHHATVGETIGRMLRGIALLPTLSACFLVLIAASGVSYAAESALPGDVLYPLKTNVLEPLQRRLHPSPEAKAQWEAELAVRRLEEAHLLRAAGRLDERTWTDLRSASRDHTKRAHLPSLKAEEQPKEHTKRQRDMETIGHRRDALLIELESLFAGKDAIRQTGEAAAGRTSGSSASAEKESARRTQPAAKIQTSSDSPASSSSAATTKRRAASSARPSVPAPIVPSLLFPLSSRGGAPPGHQNAQDRQSSSGSDPVVADQVRESVDETSSTAQETLDAIEETLDDAVDSLLP